MDNYCKSVFNLALQSKTNFNRNKETVLKNLLHIMSLYHFCLNYN